MVAFLLGDANTAIVNLGQAIKVAESTGDTSSLVRWLTLFGHGYVELNRAEQALDFYDRALRVASSIPELQVPVMTYLGKADALVRLNRSAEAEGLLTTALQAARNEGSLGYQAELTLRLGLIAAQRKQPTKALDAMSRASTLARSAGGNRVLAGIALEQSRVLRAERRLPDADVTLRNGITAARAMGERLMLPKLLAQLADVRLSRGRPGEAAALLEEADDVVEALLGRASSPWVRSRIIAGMDDVLVTRIRLEGERSRGDPTRLFAVVERARGRSLLDLLNSRPIAEDQKSPELRAGERRVSTLQLQLLRATSRNNRQRLLDEVFAAEEHLAAASTGLFAAAGQSARAPTTLVQVQRALRPDELLLEYALAEPASYVVAITRADVRLFALPGRSTMEPVMQSLVRAVHEGRPAAEESRVVGRMLVDSVPSLARYRRLIVSPDGMMHGVPFELLVTASGTPLLDTHVVSYTTSASTLVALRSRPPVNPPTQMAIAFGSSPVGPVAPTVRPVANVGANRGIYDLDAEQLRPLPSADDEAQAVVAAFHPRTSTVLVGDAATEQALKSHALMNFRIIHLAAHGIVSTKFPARSAIVLRPAGSEDGLLQAREILSLRLGADLVTLSACDTGTGTIHGQEGVASLVRPFLAAGARSVVANLWAADDEFSLGLMREFYRQLAAGADVGEALRSAKITLRRQFGPTATPKLWSGILASGDAAVTVAPISQK